MKTTKPKQEIQDLLKNIGKLYQNESLISFYNELVAIGTWPTPEKPTLKLKRQSNGVLDTTVPIPDRSLYLKVLIYELLEKIGNNKISEFI